MSLLAAEAISVRLGGNEVLRDVSLHVDRREIVTLIGPNGSGKSTLLRALLGIVPLSRGRVGRAPGLRIGYVPQRLSIDPSLPMTVRRVLSLPVRVGDDRAEAALERVGLPGVARRQMAALSGGQLQRVLLARALLSDPQLLVLDEPTQGLDPPGAAAFHRLIAEMRQAAGLAVLIVSHDLPAVMAASDRVVCLNGRVLCEGPPHAVSAAPEYRALFGPGAPTAPTPSAPLHDHGHANAPQPAAADLTHA